LIELLVVIAIIGVLLALLFPAVRAVLKAGEKTNAARTVVGLKHAFETYFSQQSSWPSSVLTSGVTDSNAVAWLTGNNTNRVRYMELAPKRLQANGDLLDPWGSLYQFRFDNANYPPQITAPNGAVINAGCIVWSRGPDITDGTRDDIRSW
jgi:type II secretory pathway pseudopilin PulG